MAGEALDPSVVAGGKDFTEWIARDEADVFSLEGALARRPELLASLRSYFDKGDLREEDLVPLMCGVRPKLHGPDEDARDFVIEEASPHGAPGLINLLGIESPGLTACLAIAERVVRIVEDGANRAESLEA